MLDPIDRLMIDDLRRVTAARLASPAGVGLRGAGKTSPAHITFDVYQKWGGRYTGKEFSARPGAYKWLRAAAVLADAGVDLDANPQHPGWADLCARRYCGNRGAFGGVVPSRAEMVEDVVRVTAAAGFLPPVRPTGREYLQMGGRYSPADASKCGGWSALCAEAGFPMGRSINPGHSRADAPRPRLDLNALRSAVLADIARVAASRRASDSVAPTSNGLSKHDYLHGGTGRFSLSSLQKVWGEGKWDGLCRAAGVKPAPPGNTRRWTSRGGAARAGLAKAHAARMPMKEIVAALDRVARPNLTLKPMARLMGYGPAPSRPARPATASNDHAPLHPDDIVADLRRVSRNAGVYLWKMHWGDYHTHGGRFTLEEMNNFGGFGALMRIAACGSKFRSAG